MMKKVIALLFLFLILTPNLALAHVLKTDSNIGAVLHIDPDDDPIINKQAGFYFEFKDKENKFDITKCDCEFFIIKNGNVIFSEKLQPSIGNNSANVFYTFNERNIYEIKIVGKPLDNAGFKDFNLNYDLRITREDGRVLSNSSININLIIIPVIVFAILIFILLRKKRFSDKKD